MKKNFKTWVSASILIVFAITLVYLASNKEGSILDVNPWGMRLMSEEEDPQAYLVSQMGICHKNGFDDCYKQVAELLFAQFEYQNLLRTIEGAQNYPEVFGRCHEVAHFIGRQAYGKVGDVKTLYSHSTPTCWGGFYHGVIEGYFENKGYKGEEAFATEIQKVCGTKEDYSVPIFFSECIHGIGHAMMFVSNDDLPKSLRWCDNLPDQGTQITCYGGVFMENSSSSTNTGSRHTSKYLRAEDPMYPCNILDEKYQNTCYRYQSSYFAQLVKHDSVKNAELCLQVPEEHIDACMSIIGSNQVGSTKNARQMSEACKSMPNSRAQKMCVNGVVSGLTGRYVKDNKMVAEFCSLVEEPHQEVCWRTMGGNIRNWAPDNTSLVPFCEVKNRQYSSWCKQGLGVEPSP